MANNNQGDVFFVGDTMVYSDGEGGFVSPLSDCDCGCINFLCACDSSDDDRDVVVLGKRVRDSECDSPDLSAKRRSPLHCDESLSPVPAAPSTDNARMRAHDCYHSPVCSEDESDEPECDVIVESPIPSFTHVEQLDPICQFPSLYNVSGSSFDPAVLDSDAYKQFTQWIPISGLHRSGVAAVMATLAPLPQSNEHRLAYRRVFHETMLGPDITMQRLVCAVQLFKHLMERKKNSKVFVLAAAVDFLLETERLSHHSLNAGTKYYQMEWLRNFDLEALSIAVSWFVVAQEQFISRVVRRSGVCFANSAVSSECKPGVTPETFFDAVVSCKELKTTSAAMQSARRISHATDLFASGMDAPVYVVFEHGPENMRAGKFYVRGLDTNFLGSEIKSPSPRSRRSSKFGPPSFTLVAASYIAAYTKPFTVPCADIRFIMA